MSIEYKKVFEEVEKWIKEHGIPRWFINIDEDITRAVYKAINDFGVLSEEEELVYNKIVYNEAESGIWYQGGWWSVGGYTDDEISGAKKFMAHCYVEQRKECEVKENAKTNRQGH